MAILVTGAAGFIGSHVVERLLDDGEEVVGIDNLDPFYDRSLKERNLARARASPRYRFFEADIRDAAKLEQSCAKAGSRLEAIIHLAARAGVRPSIADPVGYHEVNVNGTVHLLELARKHGVRQFVFASSSSVYGVNPRVPWRESDRELEPISPYASTKLAGEMTAQVYATLFNLRVVALRFFTVYGPRQRPDLAIAKFAARMRAGETIPVFGDGSTRRDYTFVADIVEGIIRALRYDASRFEVVNLGNHATVSLADMIETLGAVFETVPKVERLPEQAGDVPQTWADVSKARRLLGWEPKTTFADGLHAYRAWLDAP
ncbi:MAG: SDR family NAD(P)-dependent oxidoreductase [Opitutaceae bacterium]